MKREKKIERTEKKVKDKQEKEKESKMHSKCWSKEVKQANIKKHTEWDTFFILNNKRQNDEIRTENLTSNNKEEQNSTQIK